MQLEAQSLGSVCKFVPIVASVSKQGYILPIHAQSSKPVLYRNKHGYAHVSSDSWRAYLISGPTRIPFVAKANEMSISIPGCPLFQA